MEMAADGICAPINGGTDMLPADSTAELTADGINALIALMVLMHFKQMALLADVTDALPTDGTT
jgi:hypothetical protein